MSMTAQSQSVPLCIWDEPDKAEIDEERIEAYRCTVSLPFEPGEDRRIAVKIVDDRGIESLRIMDLPEQV